MTSLSKEVNLEMITLAKQSIGCLHYMRITSVVIFSNYRKSCTTKSRTR